jgi:hypothetical protein
VADKYFTPLTGRCVDNCASNEYLQFGVAASQ